MDIMGAAAKAVEALATRGLRTRIDEIAQAATITSERLQVKERLSSAGQYVMDAAGKTAAAMQDLKVGARAATEGLQVRHYVADAVEFTGKVAVRAADSAKDAAGAIVQEGAKVVDGVQRNHEQIADYVDTVAKGSRVLAGIAGAGAVVAAPTGLSAIGVSLGVVSAPLLVTAAPVLLSVAGAAFTVSAAASLYSKAQKRKASATAVSNEPNVPSLSDGVKQTTDPPN